MSEVWDRVNGKNPLINTPSPLTPVLRNPQFPPGMTPQHFARFEDNNLIRLCHFFQGDRLLLFADLPQSTPLNSFDYFRYLQLRSFLSIPDIRMAATKQLTPFEKMSMHTPHIARSWLNLVLLQCAGKGLPGESRKLEIKNFERLYFHVSSRDHLIPSYTTYSASLRGHANCRLLQPLLLISHSNPGNWLNYGIFQEKSFTCGRTRRKQVGNVSDPSACSVYRGVKQGSCDQQKFFAVRQFTSMAVIYLMEKDSGIFAYSVHSTSVSNSGNKDKSSAVQSRLPTVKL
ncbi:Hypothetical predicted protein [Pelobates cultripes]|uniref:Uncharacterized protein n=1 Tax=Pelobates cultripes TaxID=61616 RepID=A0AAD1SGT0_PELCU|nr:Hypothetical predicted protein [Pelobates cultripes]